MSPSGNGAHLNALRTFAGALKNSYGSLVTAQQEDQLKGPTGNLLSAFGSESGLNVIPRFEAPVPGIGRPDIALDVGGALCGYVELKAPQVSVRNLKGRDREQFNKFKTLPNLVYTNGNEWILYRDGERKQTVRLSGDVTEDGAGAPAPRSLARRTARSPTSSESPRSSTTASNLEKPDAPSAALGVGRFSSIIGPRASLPRAVDSPRVGAWPSRNLL